MAATGRGASPRGEAGDHGRQRRLTPAQATLELPLRRRLALPDDEQVRSGQGHGPIVVAQVHGQGGAIRKGQPLECALTPEFNEGFADKFLGARPSETENDLMAWSLQPPSSSMNKPSSERLTSVTERPIRISLGRLHMPDPPHARPESRRQAPLRAVMAPQPSTSGSILAFYYRFRASCTPP